VLHHKDRNLARFRPYASYHIIQLARAYLTNDWNTFNEIPLLFTPFLSSIGSVVLLRRRSVEFSIQMIPVKRFIEKSLAVKFLLLSSEFLPRPPLWSSGQSSWLHSGDVLCFL
jgi:hypothetical protein